MTFSEFNFNPTLQDGLDANRFLVPSPIQALAIPKIMEGKDLIACAQTGTGKTAAFVLPILNKIINTLEADRHLNTLILAPTRELAVQIDQAVESLGYFTGTSSIAVYGGTDGQVFVNQRRALEEGAEIVIATPGRLMSIIQMCKLDFSKLQHLVLDEADRMLDMGFINDILQIISYLPADRQTLLFSATMPPKIRSLGAKILRNPENISVAISKPAAGIRQLKYLINETDKVRLIKHILGQNDYKSTLIFASTKELVKSLEREILKQKLKCKAFHSDLEQTEREKILNEFKALNLPILIGTDIISRGIDIDSIDLVINFNAPSDAEDYVHRIGRTARAEREGTAITLINGKDQRKLATIEALIGREIEAVALPEGFSEFVGVPVKTKKPSSNNKPKKKFFKKRVGG